MSAEPISDSVAVQLPVLYFGTPVALVSTLNADGSTNLTPISAYWALGQSLMLGLGTLSQCYANVQRCGELVLNLPDAALWSRVEAIAATTGRSPVPAEKAAVGYYHHADKFALGGFQQQASRQVQPQRVADCPIQMEARVQRCHPFGEGAGVVAVEAAVLQVHAHADLLQGEPPRIRIEEWQPLLYLFRHYTTLGPCMGRNFRAEA